MATLTSYRRAAAPRAGRYVQFTAEASGNSTTTITSTALRSLSTVTGMYKDWWIYMLAASAGDKLRLVSSYAPTTSTTIGTITTDGRVYSASSVPNSKVVELHGLFPPFDDGLSGYTWTDAINDALKRLWLPIELTITPTANAVRHSLASTTWITSENQILDVGWLSSSETRANVDPYAGRHVWGEVERDGATLYLNHRPRAFGTNETIYVRAAKRVYDHCKPTAGAYGDQAGLALETDEAPVGAEVVQWGACVHAARNLRNEVTDAAADHLQNHQLEWAKLWEEARRTYHGRLPQGRFQPRRTFWQNRQA